MSLNRIIDAIILFVIIWLLVYFINIKNENEELKVKVLNEKVITQKKQNEQKVNDFQDYQKKEKERYLKAIKGINETLKQTKKDLGDNEDLNNCVGNHTIVIP